MAHQSAAFRPAILPAATREAPPAGIVFAPAIDRRADGQQRMVSLSRDIVRIDRRIEGIAMRVAVPVSAYRGVALSLTGDRAGALHYELHLLHRDQDLSVMLDCAGDDADILADWRLWSRFFRLPALVERRAGQVEEADLTLGGLLIGGAGPSRRAPRFRSKRRPSFLARRKTGNDRLSALCHIGEREIIARS